MRRARIAMVGLGAALAATWVTSGSLAAETSMKTMMRENFAGLQSILVSLVMADYSAVPPQVEKIEEHADQLTHNVPEIAEADRDRFVSYAYNLKTHASDLQAIVGVLQEHDSGKQQLGTDSLREAAAAHYGGMVTMCVACHNRFRTTRVE